MQYYYLQFSGGGGNEIVQLEKSPENFRHQGRALFAMSSGHDTVEELIEEYNIHPCCSHCGGIWHSKYSIGEMLRNYNTCFTCNHYLTLNEASGLIIGGTHYQAGKLVDKSHNDRRWLGHGGADFYILKNDGTLIHSNNVWCQGDIPPALIDNMDRFKNNAVFIWKEDYLARLADQEAGDHV